MTIHTFEVSTQLTNENYYEAQKELKQANPDKWKAEKRGMTYFGLSDKGILIKFFIIKKKKYYTYMATYRISARRVMENNNFVGLFDTENYDELEKAVNKLLKNKSKHLPKLKACNLRRIDFCVNARLDNQEQVKAYIKTMKRANIPSKLELYEEYDHISKRKKPTKDDFTVWASEYVAISVYNKYAEMKKQKKGVFPESEIQRAKNIVRMEIRCMDGKVQALKKANNVNTISEFMKKGDEIGDYLFHYYLERITGAGKLCTLKEALERVDMSGFSPENIKVLREFIETVNILRSSAEAVKIYKSTDGKKEVKRIIFMLDMIDTNYVTITGDTAKRFKNEYVPTPIELFEIERTRKICLKTDMIS